MRSIIAAFAALLFSVIPVLAQGAQDGQATPATPPPAVSPVMTGPRLLISTSMGDITLQLDAARAPKSVANILRYAREKHYDGTVFYRVVKDFVIQMGSWDANVKGRPGHPPVVFEGTNGLSNLRGTVALAHAEDPNSATAEFFVNLSDNIALNHVDGDPQKVGYTVFGQVISGMEVVDAIAAVPVGDHGPMPGQAPVTPILIKKVSVLPGDAAQLAAVDKQAPAKPTANDSPSPLPKARGSVGAAQSQDSGGASVADASVAVKNCLTVEQSSPVNDPHASAQDRRDTISMHTANNPAVLVTNSCPYRLNGNFCWTGSYVGAVSHDLADLTSGCNYPSFAQLEAAGTEFGKVMFVTGEMYPGTFSNAKFHIAVCATTNFKEAHWDGSELVGTCKAAR